jgi:hypothetical protein
VYQLASSVKGIVLMAAIRKIDKPAALRNPLPTVLHGPGKLPVGKGIQNIVPGQPGPSRL